MAVPFYNLAASQQLAFAQQPQYAWAQAAQAAQAAQTAQLQYAQAAQTAQAAQLQYAQLGSPPGYSQHGSMYPWQGAVSNDMQQAQQDPECDPVDLFLEELGIQPSEDLHFAWIAEYGLQSEVMPTRWSMHTDAESGRIYYVDGDQGTSSWENPLTNCLRAIVDIGRRYVHAPTDNFFADEKDALWDQHRRDLECWQGPLVDYSGRQYFSNTILGVSSWHDPREETQFIFEIESNLLDALEESLYGLGPEDLMDDQLPTFGGSPSKHSRPTVTDNGAEILTFDDADPPSPSSPTVRRNLADLKPSERVAQAVADDMYDQKSAFEKFIQAAGRLNELHRDTEEAQRLVLQRKAKERRLRKQRKEEDAERVRRDEEAIKMVLAAAEEEKKAEIQRQMREEQERMEEARQKKLAEEEAARLEEERKAEEEREKERERIAEIERQAEAARQAEERRRQVEAEKARQAEEERERLRKRLLELLESDDMAALRIGIADGLDAGLEAEVGLAQERFKKLLIISLGAVAKSRDVKAMRSAIADAEAVGVCEEHVEPVRKALEDELASRKAVQLKARKSKEELAAQFKDAKEAQDFGGAILAAQWRAAVREIAKPCVFEE